MSMNNKEHPLFRGHDEGMILARLKQLKQTDGEGWAIADFVEKQMEGSQHK